MRDKQVRGFRGPYRFLSNFGGKSVIDSEGIVWPTAEHLYQASKTTDKEQREQIRKCKTPAEAKRLGRKVRLRSDWEAVKLKVMEDIVARKFDQDGDARKLLIATCGLELEETNSWGDTFWGVCDGHGENHLGKILMKIRDRYVSQGNII